MMKRAILAALLATAVPAAPLMAQEPTNGSVPPGNGPPRDGKMNQVIADTLLASFIRRGYSPSNPQVIASLAGVQTVIREEMASTLSCFGQNTSGWKTFWKIIRCTTGLPVPFPMGRGGGGDYGGGGAQTQWQEGLDCADVKLEFDPAGNLIVPGFVLPFGGAVAMLPNESFKYSNPAALERKYKYWASSSQTWGGGKPGAPQTATSAGSLPYSSFRRSLHNANVIHPKNDWMGVHSTYETAGGNTCFRARSVAYINLQGVLQNSFGSTLCESGPNHHGKEEYKEGDGVLWEQKHHPCPSEGGNSDDFHFYGDRPHNFHYHNCVWYAPNPQATGTPDGYAINPKTVVVPSEFADFPNNVPEHIRRCYLDAKLVARVADGLLKKAALKPGYNGVPHETVEERDARPGDATVNDLGDNPATTKTGEPAPDPTPDEHPKPPPPAPIKETTTQPGYRDECDFGPTGCDDPQVPSPELEQEPTGLMDPIFNWLPDLPSIQLDTSSAACPVWQLDLTNFGSGWDWTVDSHCDLMEGQRGVLGALMIAVFGIGAAMIILRA